MKAIYKSAALLFGAMSFFSSCEDFLTQDPQDSYLLEDYLNTDAKLNEYTKQIYGPLTWNGFDDKFSWCVGELYSGNVYHNYADEGQFHFMSFTANNAHISNGYTSLYGVIAKCNHIINDVPELGKSNGISQEAIDKAVGEAKMFRGMAYFFLAEYWGASPIVLHNSDVVTNDNASEVTKADRKSLYTLIEMDWEDAAKLLPSTPQPNHRVWQASAYGMLTKLYVTMASCQAKLDEKGSYLCDNPDEYYQKAIEMGEKTLKLCGGDGLESGANYDLMFQPGTESSEILFSLNFEQGVYAQGCSRQIQFARSKALAGGGNAYGGEKGLTTNLFNSYDDADIRLKATSYYSPSFMKGENGDDETYKAAIKGDLTNTYTLKDGTNYYYFVNPTKTLSKKKIGELEAKGTYFGKEPFSAIFNHCRKFVYSVKPINSEFSIDLTIPLLRTADVNLLIAEAYMGKAEKNVATESSAGIKYVNAVRNRAGLPSVDKIAFCIDDPEEGNAVVATVTGIVDSLGNKSDISASCSRFISTYDLMLERRHEFALENQSWLDIKRLYYRSPKAAEQYIKSQDRGYIYGEAFGGSNYKTKDADYMRQRLIWELSVKANALNSSYAVQAKEGEIQIANLQFFLPTPASVANTASFKTVKDYSDQIKKGTYKY